MKSYYFISGLPRSGSTLLSAILRQNSKFYADIASPLQSIVTNTIDFISGCESNLNLTVERRKDILLSLFDGYYSFLEKPVVFDSSRAWTKNTTLLQELFPNTKILCCVRDIPWIINSFEIINKKNPFYSSMLVKKELSDNVFSRSDAMMDNNCGIIAGSWISLQEGFALNPEMIYFVEYDNLCKNPENEMKNIYKFLEQPYYSHDFDNVEYSNHNFDMSCNLKDLHTVRNKVEYKKQKKVLPPEVWEKFESMNMEFWRKGYRPDPDIIEKLDKKFISYQ
jgi:sulfotransferase